MRYLITAVLVVSMLTACEDSSSTQKKTEASNELIINLTSDATISAHGSLMGIHLARIMHKQF